MRSSNHLRAFLNGVILDAREVVYSLLEAEAKLGFSRTLLQSGIRVVIILARPTNNGVFKTR